MAFFVLISSIEFEQRLLILDTQQPAGRLTATVPVRAGAVRALCPRGKLAQLAEQSEDNWVNRPASRAGSRWFKSNRGSQKIRQSSDCLIFIQSEGLACNLTAGEYVIAEGVWHHASACILLRIDYIQHFVLIPYRRQAADFIHAYRRDYIESYVEALDFGGLLCF